MCPALHPPVIDRMSPLDAAFLYAEDGTTHMHIGSCAVFEGPAPRLDELVAMVEHKLHLLPRYRQRARFIPAGLGHPVWVDDPGFDVRSHVRRTSLSGRWWRGRPRAVDGAPDVRGARPASAAVGGLVGGGPRRRQVGADLEGAPLHGRRHRRHRIDGSTARRPSATPTLPMHRRSGSRHCAPTATALALDAVVQLAAQPARLAASWWNDIRHPGLGWARTRADLAGLASLRARATRPTPRRSTEGTIGPRRSWAVARCSLAELKAIRVAFGGSVNDVALAAVTAAFRDQLLRRGDTIAPTDIVRALVPVSVRTPGDHTTNNQVSMMVAELPIGCDTAVERLQSITAQMAVLKSSHQIEAAAAAFDATVLVPPAIVAATIKTAIAAMHAMPQHLLHTVVTNVPGPQQPLYAIGRRMVEYLPFVPGERRDPHRRGSDVVRRSRRVRPHGRSRIGARAPGHGRPDRIGGHRTLGTRGSSPHSHKEEPTWIAHGDPSAERSAATPRSRSPWSSWSRSRSAPV